MKYTVRSFSIGLFAAGLIMLIVYYFFDETSTDLTKYETDELIAHLEESGYRIVTEEEFISISVADANNHIIGEYDEVDETDDADDGSESTDNTEFEDEEETIEIKTITIDSGMV